MFDTLIRRARLPTGGPATDVAIAAGRIAAIAPTLHAPAARTLDAEGRLLLPGLIDTHIHLDKCCIHDRCRLEHGTLAEAVAQTAAAKRAFTPEDVYARARQTLERCITWGTTAMRTHVEMDPGIGTVGFDAVQQLSRDYAWAIDVQLCVFPQEGLTNNPGTEPLLVEGLRRGATVLGAAPYTDTDPRAQIDRIFALARDHGVDIDMHLDLADTADGMQVDYVCRKTEEYGWGGRVAVGHLTQLSFADPARYAAVAATLARAGVAVTVLPATDLFLMGRNHSHAVPRGVTPLEGLRAAGVCCSVATNNVLNPFTPYGDGSLVRMANLYANVAQLARPDDLAACLDMVGPDAARLMRRPGHAISVGHPADLLLLDAPTPADAVAALAQPLWGMKGGRQTFTRPRPTLHPFQDEHAIATNATKSAC